jgi:hypothetical protein
LSDVLGLSMQVVTINATRPDALGAGHDAGHDSVFGVRA